MKICKVASGVWGSARKKQGPVSNNGMESVHRLLYSVTESGILGIMGGSFNTGIGIGTTNKV